MVDYFLVITTKFYWCLVSNLGAIILVQMRMKRPNWRII